MNTKYYYIIIIISFFTARELNLQSSINYALDNSTNVKLSDNLIEISKAQAKDAGSLIFPKVSGYISTKYNFSLPEQTIDFGGISQTIKFGNDQSANLGISINQIIFEGRVFSAIRSSKFYNKISQSSYEYAKLKVIEQTKHAFYLCLFASQSYNVINKSYNRALNSYENTALLFEKGNKREFDKIQSESLVAKRKTDLINTEKTLKIAKENLKQIIGYPLDKEITVVGTLKLDEIWDLNFDKLKSEMINNQPLIEQSNFNLDLMNENIKYNKSSFYPGIYLDATYNMLQDFDKGNFDFNNFTENTYIGLNISVPILEISNFAKLKMAKAEFNKSRYEKLNLENTLILELKNLLLTYSETKQKLLSAEKQLELGLKGQIASKRLYDRGMITQIEFESAELSLLQAELQVAQVKFEYLTTVASIERSIGTSIRNHNE